ncbi:hypothetical protein K490DRAFT_46886 [Saccharata proteae CBS 121410]|uniref:Uncharacterized protein n=1 Tax=Saccharata proteae CBS 121410 TaxID=1314787 RepID=A0A9P4HSS3_9PEZI|nr:hypothetical protein K490DRAFT_46886 [Saccharata proteae CBS 121410]
MGLTVKALNADTSFLLTFTPPTQPSAASETHPSSDFTILLDPWLSGPAQILSSKFSISRHRAESCLSSLAELPEPDLIIISQDKPDHCHEATLRQLSSHTSSLILAAPAAAKKIRRWRHFDPVSVHTLRPYDNDGARIFRISVPASSPKGVAGEVTVAYMPAKRDISGLHNAIGITYRPQTNEPTTMNHYITLPPTPPDSPQTKGTSMNDKSRPLTPPTPRPAREKTLSVLYSPHGVAYATVAPYASQHLVSVSALPLTALLHSFDRVDNPWYLGGNIAAGMPGGLDIVRCLMARAWIGAHDGDKDNKGISVAKLRIRRFEIREIQEMIKAAIGGGENERNGDESDSRLNKIGTQVVKMGVGEEYRVKID